MVKKSVALFDLDKTIYKDHSFFGIVKYFVDEGVLPTKTWSDVSEELAKYKSKIQNYSLTANNLLEIFVRDLEGKSESEIQILTEKFFEVNKGNFYPFFAKLLPEIKRTHDIYLVTTNFQPAAKAVVKMFDLDGYISTEFEIIEGKFTGKVSSTLANGKSVVDELVSKYSGDTMAYGDSENDIEMLKRVKTAVCINPSPELRAEALVHGWTMLEYSNNG